MRGIGRMWGMAAGAAWIALALTTVLGMRPAEASEAYLRYPDIQGNRIVFTAEGDLWTASTDGTGARKLTSHPGDEVLAKFSPDGKWIAFAGDYDGNRDLFVVPADGGEPKRLTWHPGPDEPLGWTPDSKEIYFRAMRDEPNWNWDVYRIPATGGDPVKLPIGYVVTFSADPVSGRYAFTRIGGGGTWKRYRGGSADDIWVGDPKQNEFKKVTDFPGMDASPMWYGGRIWFLSDPGGTVNLWSMNPDGSDRKRQTDSGQWDARWPSMDPGGQIAYVLAGDIHVLDCKTGTDRKLTIDLPSERLLTRVRYPNPSQYLSFFSLAPEGDRVAVEARGEVFSIPAKEGITLPVTGGSGAREKYPTYSPDGKRIAYVTDASGEETIATADAWGRGEVKQVAATGKSVFHYPVTWSPDGQWIAWSDQTQTLYIVKAAGGEPITVDHSDQSEMREYSWSPDGRYLAYSKANRIDWSAVFIYDTKDKTAHQATGFDTNSGNPAWDPEGRYLYFLSDRTVNPVIDWRDFETILGAAIRPYALLLRADVPDPFAKEEGAPPRDGEKSDGKHDKKDAKKGDKKDGEKKDKKGESEEKEIKPITIDFDGLTERVVEFPVDPGRYFALGATAKSVFWISQPQRGLTEEESDDEDNHGPKGTLHSFNLEDKEDKPFMEGVGAYDLQPGSSKIAVQKERGEIYVLDADSPPGDDLSKSKIATDDMVLELDPRAEWRQMFFEGWRNMRDFYWDAGMHGVDWTVIRDQYASLLSRISTREDLRDLMAEMIGELATSHTYTWGGDPGVDVARRPTGLLGAVVVREGDAFKITRIYRGADADRVRSPLREPNAHVKEGDYIFAVNHHNFLANEPFEALMENLAGKEVLLTVGPTPDRKGARDVAVKPMGFGDESDLRYSDWVRQNREYVASKTGGKIGYIHIPDMGGRGLREFDTWFYPQLDKEGMVVDNRWNGGGFVSQLIVARLQRHLLWWDRARWGGLSTYPYRVLNGPFVVLTNQFAGSDGDIFPAAVQAAGLGPVIGMRSWGGVIGIRGNARPLVDSGALTQPEYAFWQPKKGWAIENHGVDPDIVIENMPQDLGRGLDPQLDRAVIEVMKLHEQTPPLVPAFTPAPDRSRKSYEGEK